MTVQRPEGTHAALWNLFIPPCIWHSFLFHFSYAPTCVVDGGGDPAIAPPREEHSSAPSVQRVRETCAPMRSCFLRCQEEINECVVLQGRVLMKSFRQGKGEMASPYFFKMAVAKNLSPFLGGNEPKSSLSSGLLSLATRGEQFQ